MKILTVFGTRPEIIRLSVIIDLLDRLLLILMIVEVMYTVQVSFREHALAPEPFLIGRDVWRRRDLLSRAPRR